MKILSTKQTSLCTPLRTEPKKLCTPGYYPTALFAFDSFVENQFKSCKQDTKLLTPTFVILFY